MAVMALDIKDVHGGAEVGAFYKPPNPGQTRKE